MTNLKNDLKMLNNGILPPSFNFNNDNMNNSKNSNYFDVELIKYNTFKRVFENRYSHLQELPAFNEIIDAMNDNALLPNDEINLRKKMNKILEDNLIF